MKTIVFTLQAIIVFLSCFILNAQSDFSLEKHKTFLKNTQDLTFQGISGLNPLEKNYYSEIDTKGNFESIFYLDSLKIKYELTEEELALLKKNHFMVTERLNKESFVSAYADIFHMDMPVFISTDFVLHAMHMSYDKILIDLEKGILETNLISITNQLHSNFSKLWNNHHRVKDEIFSKALSDIDVYVTVAKSLMEGGRQSPYLAENIKTVDTILYYISEEGYIEMPLFTDENRKLDFSQYTVRGHYEEILEEYFRTMMWLGRTDFWLTSPPFDTISQNDLRRMCYASVLMNELLDLANVKSLLDINDKLITFMAGESDNLTPKEFNDALQKLSISDAEDILNDTTYGKLISELKTGDNYGQKILSDVIIMDPFSSEPDVLPVSYKLMGQRFVIDSYVFSNVVYDRIVFEGKKIWRPMPNPLDALFALGNNDALPLLQDELDTYHYNQQLATMRFLIDEYDADFWENSIYNQWLTSIRTLNPDEDNDDFPLFMKTDAWRMEKINTQLASWSQLRHDNLLYAKQSYTGGASCSYPHSYVEPYTFFYESIANYAKKAKQFFADFSIESFYALNLERYFDNLAINMDFLKEISQKELSNMPFTIDEIDRLKRMLFKSEEMMCGLPPYDGWLLDLFYEGYDQGIKKDFIVADVHTQPTDAAGNIVGRVLHVGVGEVNMGIFLTPSPSNGFEYTAYVGPVMSYYEKITENFDRLTDSRWEEMNQNNQLPGRPEWTKIYLADSSGTSSEKTKSLPYTKSFTYTVGLEEPSGNLLKVSPNPVHNRIYLGMDTQKVNKVSVLSLDGRQVVSFNIVNINEGIDISEIPNGMYIIRAMTDKGNYTAKILKR